MSLKINLVASVKMPYPESLSRNCAKTERVWIDRGGATTGCIRIEDRRWCYEHIAPDGNRAEMLRIRNEPSRGVYIGALFYYMVDLDLDGLVDVGSTTKIEALDQRQPVTPIANVIQFFHRSTKRAEQSQPDTRRCTTKASRWPSSTSGIAQRLYKIGTVHITR
jgi:hypothetical protein